MADTSRSQVTITLGRSGQVVKRGGAVLDNDILDPIPAVGRKRSVKERLGSSVDSVCCDNKRQCGYNGRFSVKASDGVADTHLSKHDLRFKILKQTQHNGKLKNVDLRDMLSRKIHLSSTNHRVHQSLPDPGSSRQKAPQLTPEPRDGTRHMPDDQRLMHDPVDVGPHMLKPYDNREHILDTTDGSMPGRLTSRRTSKTLSQMDLSRTSFSLSSLDQIGRRSPNGVLDNSGVLSQPPRTEEPLGRPIMKAYNDPRAVTYGNLDLCEIASPMTTASFPMKPPLSDGTTKAVGPLVMPQLPMRGIVQPSQCPVEHLTVEGFLHSLGLDKYVIFFRLEEVDMATLTQMGDRDLKELGIPMGPRKKIILALLVRTRRQSMMSNT